MSLYSRIYLEIKWSNEGTYQKNDYYISFFFKHEKNHSSYFLKQKQIMSGLFLHTYLNRVVVQDVLKSKINLLKKIIMPWKNMGKGRCVLNNLDPGNRKGVDNFDCGKNMEEVCNDITICTTSQNGISEYLVLVTLQK